MIKRAKWYAAGAVVGAVTLAWPGPGASADTNLGGYTASARAEVVHVEIYEPVIPIPGSPQIDGSVAYTKATTDTGPANRATASYLWPGDVIGDGFEQLTHHPGQTYPVQVNSRYPATQSAPANNTAQITDGNGMTTESSATLTKGTVTLVGISGAGTNLVSGVGTGLSGLLGKSSAPKAPTIPLPVPETGVVAGLVNANNVTSDSQTLLGQNTVTATAHAAAANLSLFAGLVKLDGVDVRSEVVSDGAKATSTGVAKIGGITLAGVKLDLGSNGLDLSGTNAALPDLGATLSSLVKSIGISMSVTPVTKTVTGATGTVTSQVLQVSLDTTPLKSILNVPLNAVVKLLGSKAATQLAPLIALSPRIVLTIGDTTASASASPAFNYPTGGGGGAAGVGGAGVGGVTTGGGGSAGTYVPNVLGGGTSPYTSGTGQTSQQPLSSAPAALNLPALGSVPKALILGGLVLAGVLGWVLRLAAAGMLGAGARCTFGLATGVPDLRKG